MKFLTSAGPILALKFGKTLLKDSKLFDERLKRRVKAFCWVGKASEMENAERGSNFAL
jgi:hypothetical protein